jgi:L-iditol 2-dehydrogenase
VIVFGAGTVGLLVAAMAKLSGATTVMIADINARRVKYALDNKFATRGYVVPQSNHNGHTEKTGDRFEEAKTLASDVVDRACAGETDFEGADVTFDCTGKEICMQTGLYVSS